MESSNSVKIPNLESFKAASPSSIAFGSCFSCIFSNTFIYSKCANLSPSSIKVFGLEKKLSKELE